MDSRNGIGWYVAAAVIALAGVAAGVVLAVKAVLGIPEPERFIAPGRLELEVPAPGSQVLWLEYRTMYHGRTWNVPKSMPDGAQLQVIGPDGRPVELEPSGNFSWQGSGGERQSVGRFEASTPGRYTITVQGGFEPRVLSAGPDMLKRLLVTIGLSVAIAVASFGAGAGIALYAFLHRIPSSSPPSAAPATDAEREQKLRQLTAIVYGLQAVSLLGGVTLLAAVILNYLKRGDIAGTWLESHFEWQIRTFWWMLLLAVLGFATAFILVGIPVLLGAAVWLVYRIAKGWSNLNDGLPMPG